MKGWQGLAILEVGVFPPPPTPPKKATRCEVAYSNNLWVDDFKFKMIDVETSG